MALLSFSGLSKAFGTQVCFDHIVGEVHEGDRIGLIGANGTGKSTLARVLCGLDMADEGRLGGAKDLVIEYLTQDPQLDPSHTLREAALEAFADLREIEARIDELSHAMADPDCTPEALEAALEETGRLQQQLEARGGYTIDSRTDAVLMGLGFAADEFGKPASGLSGGERSRVGLARVLLREPDMMVLDEPTNHLDITGVQWLEGYLRDSFRGAFIVISHDRYFLDQVATRIFELEGGRLEIWKGNYTRSRELKVEALERRLKEYEQQQAGIAKQQEYIRRYGAGQRAREAKGRKRRLDRFVRDEAIDRPDAPQRKPQLEISTDRRVGAEVCEVRDLWFSYDGETTLLHDVAFKVRTNEVLAIVGPNGAGKSTLLKCLTGELQPSGGQVRVGSTIHPAVLAQREEFAEEHADTSIFEYVHSRHPKTDRKGIRDLLAALLFRGDEVDKPIRVLSGGERKRVALADLLMGDANLLYLDEPTNHLDLPAREALEDALMRFPGTIVMVSHDRYLLDRLADRVLWLSPEPGFATPAPENDTLPQPEARVFDGGFTDMLETVRGEQRARAARRAKQEANRKARESRQAGNQAVAAPAPKKQRKRFRGTLEELEAAIEAAQAKVLEVEEELGQPDTYNDPDRVKELTAEYEELKAEMDGLETEWLERSA